MAVFCFYFTKGAPVTHTSPQRCGKTEKRTQSQDQVLHTIITLNETKKKRVDRQIHSFTRENAYHQSLIKSKTKTEAGNGIFQKVSSPTVNASCSQPKKQHSIRPKQRKREQDLSPNLNNHRWCRTIELSRRTYERKMDLAFDTGDTRNNSSRALFFHGLPCVSLCQINTFFVFEFSGSGKIISGAITTRQTKLVQESAPSMRKEKAMERENESQPGDLLDM